MTLAQSASRKPSARGPRPVTRCEPARLCAELSFSSMGRFGTFWGMNPVCSEEIDPWFSHHQPKRDLPGSRRCTSSSDSYGPMIDSSKTLLARITRKSVYVEIGGREQKLTPRSIFLLPRHSRHLSSRHNRPDAARSIVLLINICVLDMGSLLPPSDRIA